MGMSDRRYRDGAGGSDWDGQGGGLRRALRRIFVEGDGFFSWSLPLFTVAGVRVRIHLLYLVVIAVQLLKPIQPGAAGLAYTAFFMGSLFVLVLAHEFGHVIACRKVGGEADEIIMWPLGGLAMCRPPHDWRSSLITTLGGPAVNLGLFFVFGGVLLALGAGWRTVLFNPLETWSRLATEPWFNVNAAHWKTLLYSAHVSNAYLFLFNMLMVMFPLDAGRVMQELLWRKMGFRRSMQIAANAGLVMAVIVGTVALFGEQSTLLGIALFAGITCYGEKRRLMMTDDPYADVLEQSSNVNAREEERKYKKAMEKQEQERAAQAEVDRILAKIAQSGMGSLTGREKRVLRDATERQRSGGR